MVLNNTAKMMNNMFLRVIPKVDKKLQRTKFINIKILLLLFHKEIKAINILYQLRTLLSK